jgi:hypothetical protein
MKAYTLCHKLIAWSRLLTGTKRMPWYDLVISVATCPMVSGSIETIPSTTVSRATMLSFWRRNVTQLIGVQSGETAPSVRGKRKKTPNDGPTSLPWTDSTKMPEHSCRFRVFAALAMQRTITKVYTNTLYGSQGVVCKQEKRRG